MSSPSSTNGARGRQALFSGGVSAPAATGSGRRALFSAPPRRRGTVVVECGRCQSRTPVPVVEFWTLLPTVWLPGRRFSRLLRCPACKAFAWCHVAWRSLFAT